MSRVGLAPLLCVFASLAAASVQAQGLTHRGFVEARVSLFPQTAVNDPRRVVGDLVAREEVFVRVAGWLRFAAGADLRANSYEQVEPSWRVRFDDRTGRRPAVAIRRLSATLSSRGWTVDLGKQFIRWGKVDIVTPTDRFSPRDYLAVIENELLAVRGARVSYAIGGDTFEAVVVPSFTPSRIPLLTQRWTVVPASVALEDASPAAPWPGGTQAGLRWSHVGAGYEYAIAVFDGFNHLPNVQLSGAMPTPVGTIPGATTAQSLDGVPAGSVDRIPVALTRTYPQMRMYGGDIAVPTRWLTLKGEAAYFTTTTAGTDEFLLSVIQAERQTGEWLLIGGYAGLTVTRAGGGGTFAPDRGTARSFIGRASYTIDSNRSAAVEAAIRQTGDGIYVKGEFSRNSGAHWRATMAGVLIRGDQADFLGQFRRNSHVSLALHYSF